MLLVSEFTKHKKTGVVPASFGRDAPYGWPDAVLKADMHHLHLAERSRWPIRVVQYYRRSDKHLMYCRGFRSVNNYLLLALFEDAHERAENLSFMLAMAEMAARFREKF